MTNVNGKVQKTGGNVVSYFLTPEGRVIDAVGGPVAADKLLDAARFSVDTWQQAMEAGKRFDQRALIVGQAHQRMGGGAVHAYLAERPLAPLPLVSDQFFQQLAGEKSNTDRTPVAMAAAEFAKARKAGRPVLLVLDRADAAKHGENPLANQVRMTLTSRPAMGPAARCQIIYLPVNQLAALSNLVEAPQFALADANLPTLVLCRSTGEQIVALAGTTPGNELATHLIDALKQERANRKAKLQVARKM
ncbi:MAG: hypothetical protein ACREJM_08955 [Candidatus Saccharimonadales bacterium]